MKRLLSICLVLLLIGSASALPLWGPAQGFRNPGAVELGSLTIDGVSIDGGNVSYDEFVAGMVTNETAINASIAALLLAAYTNETAINTTIAAMPGSLINTAYGLKNESGEIIVNLTADKGLEFGTGAALGGLQIKAGDGIDLASGGIAVDMTDLIVTSDGLWEKTDNNIAINLTEDGGLGLTAYGELIVYPYYGLKTTSNGLEVNLTADKGLEFGTGAAENSLQIKLDGSSLSVGSSGLKVTDNTYAGKTASYTNETAINTSIAALTVPLVSFPYTADVVDQAVFTASGGWVLTSVVLTPTVAGTGEGAATVMVKLCDSAEAPASGDAMLNSTLDLEGTIHTPQTGALTTDTGVSIPDGKIVALDFTGTLTSSVGSITLYGKRA